MTATSVSDTRSVHELARNLLDCDEAVDAAARQAIDAALRRRSSDPVVHAAALQLAYATDGELRLGRSYARGWAPGLHELIDSGRLDAAAYAVPKLNVMFPHIPYFESMVFVFRHLPSSACNDREPLVDDLTSDVQVVTTPGADTVVIAFCGATHQLGISLNLVDRWFARLGCHIIYVRDRKKIGYTGGIEALGEDQARTIEGMAGLVRDLGASQVLCLGNSAGASGALRYAGPLGAERVLALAPITGGPKYSKKIAPHLPPDGVMWWGDLVPPYRRGTGVRARIMYGEKNAGDRQQSVRMAGLPGITVEALADCESHHLIGGLVRAGRLDEVLGWLVHGDSDDPDLKLREAPNHGRKL